MSKTIARISTVSSSSSEDTDSTRTQTDSISSIQNSFIFDNIHLKTNQISNLSQINSSDENTIASKTAKKLRKCQSFVQVKEK